MMRLRIAWFLKNADRELILLGFPKGGVLHEIIPKPCLIRLTTRSAVGTLDLAKQMTLFAFIHLHCRKQDSNFYHTVPQLCGTNGSVSQDGGPTFLAAYAKKTEWLSGVGECVCVGEGGAFFEEGAFFYRPNSRRFQVYPFFQLGTILLTSTGLTR